MKRVSLNTVARRAGVSKTTASLVLNGKATQYHIAATTVERVKQAARELKYNPNKLILNSFSGQSKVIGLIAPAFNTPGAGEWLQHLIPEARSRGFQIIPETGQREDSNIHTVIQDFENFGADGLLILFCKTPDNISPAGKGKGFPVVFAGSRPENPAIHSVTDDFVSGINMLIEHLYRHNKRAIGYMGRNVQSIEKVEKRDTYLKSYCERFEISPNIELVADTNTGTSKIVNSCNALIDRGANSILFEDPELAVAAFSDNKLRAHLQQHIFCASYGFHPALKLIDGDFISVHSNIQLMAHRAIELLVRLINDEAIEPPMVKTIPVVWGSGK